MAIMEANTATLDRTGRVSGPPAAGGTRHPRPVYEVLAATIDTLVTVFGIADLFRKDVNGFRKLSTCSVKRLAATSGERQKTISQNLEKTGMATLMASIAQTSNTRKEISSHERKKRKTRVFLLFSLCFPKSKCDIFSFAVGQNLIQPLVCSTFFETAQRFYVRSYLYVIKIFQFYAVGKCLATRIPAYLNAVCLFEPFRHTVHLFRVVVTAHDGDARNGFPVIFQDYTGIFFIERLADIFPKKCAMAMRAAVRAVCDIHGQRDLVGDFLKDNVVVVELKHLRSTPLLSFLPALRGGSVSVRLPSGAHLRNC
jgi:hypothetical protein